MDYRELILQYADSLRTDLTWASKTHINMLTMLAAENKAAAASICATIERHILSVGSRLQEACTLFGGTLNILVTRARLCAGSSFRKAPNLVPAGQYLEECEGTLHWSLLSQPDSGANNFPCFLYVFSYLASPVQIFH